MLYLRLCFHMQSLGASPLSRRALALTPGQTSRMPTPFAINARPGRLARYHQVGRLGAVGQPPRHWWRLCFRSSPWGGLFDPVQPASRLHTVPVASRQFGAGLFLFSLRLSVRLPCAHLHGRCCVCFPPRAPDVYHRPPASTGACVGRVQAPRWGVGVNHVDRAGCR